MKKNKKSIIARSAFELANVLGLEEGDAVEMDFRAKLNKKIINVIQRQGLTHVEVAKKAKASRTRITAILNGHTAGISTDFLLRVLYSLGYRTKITFAPKTITA